MAGAVIDWTIRASDLAIVASVLTTGAIYVFRSGRFTQTILTMKDEIGELKEDVKTLNQIMTDVAVQKTRLDMQAERMNIIDRRVDDLTRGRQLGLDRGLDGEYAKSPGKS